MAESIGCSRAAHRDTATYGVRTFDMCLTAVDDVDPQGRGRRSE